jgi:hypothetical protein
MSKKKSVTAVVSSDLVRCEGRDTDNMRCKNAATEKVKVIGYQCEPYSESWQEISVCHECAMKIVPNIRS